VDYKDMVHRFIRFGTKGDYGHTLVAFEDAKGRRWYYESISKVNTFVGPDGKDHTKNGVRGPLPITRLEAWCCAKSRQRNYLLLEIKGLVPEEISAMQNFLVDAVPRIRYAKFQIAQNALYLMTGRLGGVKTMSPDKWTCSETACRSLPTRVKMAIGVGEFCYDWVCPSGRKGFGLLEKIEEWNEHQS
jgi:hypothetical protein